MARKDGKDRGLFEKPKGTWWIRWTDAQGHEHKRKVGLKTDAKAERVRVLAEKQKARLYRVPTVEEAIHAYCSGVGADNVSWRDDRTFAGLWGDAIGNVRLDQVTAAMVEQYKLAWSHDVARSTVNRRLGFLKRIFEIARRDGHVTVNPVSQVGQFVENNTRRRYLTPDEEVRLKAVVPTAWWPYILWAIHTGMRQGEQFGLRWEHVDMAHRLAHVPKSKTGQSRVVQLNKTAMAILMAAPSRLRSEWVFPSVEGKRLNQANFLNRVWHPALQAAGIEDFVWHDLRHTHATRLRERGVPLDRIKDLLGHEWAQTTERYAHIDPHYLREAVHVLDEDEPVEYGSRYGTLES